MVASKENVGAVRPRVQLKVRATDPVFAAVWKAVYVPKPKVVAPELLAVQIAVSDTETPKVLFTAEACAIGTTAASKVAAAMAEARSFFI